MNDFWAAQLTWRRIDYRTTVENICEKMIILILILILFFDLITTINSNIWNVSHINLRIIWWKRVNFIEIKCLFDDKIANENNRCDQMAAAERHRFAAMKHAGKFRAKRKKKQIGNNKTDYKFDYYVLQ